MIKLLFIFGSFLMNPKDSVGVETIDGKLFVIHRVDDKETLFGISKRYRADIDDILKYNQTVADGLEVGQIIKVPYTKPVNRPADGIVHKVEPKETMFSISKKYNVSVDDLRKWNNLADNSISVGQELIINRKPAALYPSVNKTVPEMASKQGTHTVAASETLYSIARQYKVTVDQLVKWNNLASTEVKPGQTLFLAQPEYSKADKITPKQTVIEQKREPVTQSNTKIDQPKKDVEPKKEAEQPKVVKADPPKTEPTQTQTIKISESVRNGNEMIESGIAELIVDTEGNRKYLALHRTAPVGTILKVRNEMNNREVFVRVMGKLPDTAFTDKVIIRVSKSAYDRLGAIDQRFRVEVTYYK